MLSWEQTFSGVWRARVGPAAPLTLTDLAAAPPRAEALNGMGAADFPFSEPVLGDYADGRTVLRFPLGPDEQLYGGGLQFQGINQRTRVLHLRVDHYGGSDNGRTHAPCPFYVSSRGYGVLVNTARFVSFYLGSAVRRDSASPPTVRDRTTDREWTAQPLSDAVEVSLQGESVEILVFGGTSPIEAVRRYVLYCGGGCLPPRWGLGFWHRTPLAHSQEQIVAEVREFRQRGFPLQVVGLEPGWQSGAYPCTHTWDPVRFPDPSGLCEDLAALGVRVNLWENPYLSPESPIYDRIQPLSGSHTVWCGIVPDTTLPDARELIQQQQSSEHLDAGVSGYKLDECDGVDSWLWPDHATFPSGHSGEVMRQTYGLQWQKLTTEMFSARNRRTYGLVRGSNAGGAGYPFAIYSDCYDLRQFLTGLCNSGFAGVLWTPEARSAATAEEWVRRMQLVCFSPLAMLNAWADGTKPWSFPEVAELVQAIMRLRLRFIPYLYTAFARYRLHGTPPFRAMALEGLAANEVAEQGELDATHNPYALATAADITDQYMMGDCLLVAPMLPGQTSRHVVLPQGDWADFDTGELLEGGRVVEVEAPLERIPLFVRAGGIIPLSCEDDPAALEVRHYGGIPGRFDLYEDDGETMAYERGDLTWLRLTAVAGEDGGLVGKEKQISLGRDPRWTEYRWRFMG